MDASVFPGIEFLSSAYQTVKLDPGGAILPPSTPPGGFVAYGPLNKRIWLDPPDPMAVDPTNPMRPLAENPVLQQAGYPSIGPDTTGMAATGTPATTSMPAATGNPSGNTGIVPPGLPVPMPAPAPHAWESGPSELSKIFGSVPPWVWVLAIALAFLFWQGNKFNPAPLSDRPRRRRSRGIEEDED